MSDARSFASNLNKATQASVQLAVRGFMQQIEFLNGLLKNAQENIKSLQAQIKSLQDQIKTLTTERDAALSNETIAVRLMLQEKDRNNELLARIAEVEAENNLLKSQHDQDYPLFSQDWLA